MKSYDRIITIRINVENDKELTNKELDKAFGRLTEIISVEIDENSIFMDAAQEEIQNAEVVNICIPRQPTA